MEALEWYIARSKGLTILPFGRTIYTMASSASFLRTSTSITDFSDTTTLAFDSKSYIPPDTFPSPPLVRSPCWLLSARILISKLVGWWTKCPSGAVILRLSLENSCTHRMECGCREGERLQGGYRYPACIREHFSSSSISFHLILDCRQVYFLRY